MYEEVRVPFVFGLCHMAAGAQTKSYGRVLKAKAAVSGSGRRPNYSGKGGGGL